MIEVWSWPTPNGHKVHIALEELGLEYEVIRTRPSNAGMTKSRRGPRCNAASRYWPTTRVIVKSATPNARTRLGRRNLPRVDCRVVSTNIR